MSRFGGYVSFDEYFAKENRVYVRNRTNPLGYVSVNIGDNRNPKYFTVLKTVIPMCLTDLFDKEEIRKSTDLRQLVMKGAIELVTEKEYIATVTPDLAEKVNEALMNYESRSVGGQRIISSESGDEVKPVVVQLIRMNTLSEDERKEMGNDLMTDEEIITELETLDLSSVDKSYIFTNSAGKVKAWITKMLSTESGVNLAEYHQSGEDYVDDTAEVDISNESMPVDTTEKLLSEAEKKLVKHKHQHQTRRKR